MTETLDPTTDRIEIDGTTFPRLAEINTLNAAEADLVARAASALAAVVDLDSPEFDALVTIESVALDVKVARIALGDRSFL